MKLAVLSDIHGNVPALEAVLEDLAAWGPDAVVVNGDLVSRGPRSGACLALVERHLPTARCLRGNHENWVIASADGADDPDDPTRDLKRLGRWTAERLGGRVDTLRAWGDHAVLADAELGAAGRVHVTHASRLSDRDGIYAHTPDDELARKVGPEPGLCVVSHTHLPLVRRLNGTLVVNIGSVGQPFDGDPRAAYGRFRFRDGAWHAQIARVAFDRERALRDMDESGFMDGAGPMARVIRRELAEARPHIAPWRRRYLAAVKAGEITVAEAVERYLAALA